ncbi:kinase-like protein [Clavulina sp. PMI_390]|nr:kinase-like protein [Clavulina sp. PMI_390]
MVILDFAGVTWHKKLFGVIEGVCYLHSLEPPLIHGGLQPVSVLMDQEGTPHLCDFGFRSARQIISRAGNSRIGGIDTRFLAPELLIDRFRTTCSSDVYGFAMLFFNVWTGEQPFGNVRIEWRMLAKVADGERPELPTGRKVHIPQTLEGLLWTLVEKMWAQDPSHRPTSEDVSRRLKEIFAAKSPRLGVHVPTGARVNHTTNHHSNQRTVTEEAKTSVYSQDCSNCCT